MNEFDRDPARDPRLKELLHAAEPPPAEVNWQALQRSIHERAELSLARRRREQAAARPQPTHGMRWLRPALPLAAAASMALALALPSVRSAVMPGFAWTGSDAHLRPVVEEVLGAELSDPEFDLLFDGVSTDALLLAAVQQQ